MIAYSFNFLLFERWLLKMSARINEWEYKYFYALYLISKEVYTRYVMRYIDKPKCESAVNLPECINMNLRLNEDDVSKSMKDGVFVIQTQELSHDFMKYKQGQCIFSADGFVKYNDVFDTKLQFEIGHITDEVSKILYMTEWKHINKTKYVILLNTGDGNWEWHKLSYFRQTAFSKLKDAPVTAVIFDENNLYHVAFAKRFVADYPKGIDVQPTFVIE